jgi:hypothetical protein
MTRGVVIPLNIRGDAGRTPWASPIHKSPEQAKEMPDGRADQNPGQFILSSLIPVKKGKLPDAGRHDPR